MRTSTRFILPAIAMLIVACTSDTGQVSAPDAMANRTRGGGTHHAEVRLQRLGHPLFQPVDFHMFSAPIGTPESGFAEFNEIAASIQPPPNHVQRPDLGTGPGAPHAPPYNMELAKGLVPLGFHEGDEFRRAEFSGENGVWLIWMTIPVSESPAIGSSPDFASGPIIPNSIFPISLHITTTRNGVPFDEPFDFSVPALDANLDPPFYVDGHSHFSIIGTDGFVFATDPSKPVQGHYEYRFVFTDKLGSGWLITARFEVE